MNVHDSGPGTGRDEASEPGRRKIEPAPDFALLSVLAAPAAAQAKSSVRFFHAVPGAGSAELQASSDGKTVNAGQGTFAKAGHSTALHAGKVTFELHAANGGKSLASLALDVREAQDYTVVALLDM